jgi:general secretion pathway protein A
MYNAYWGFRESPFSLSPDPAFLYRSEQHEEALANLTYGVESRKGFTVLTGEVGTGKTTLLACLRESLHKQYTAFAKLDNSRITSAEFFEMIAYDLELRCVRKSKTEVLFALNQLLLEQDRHGRTTALIVDEAQNLEWDVLEEIRLLGNFENRHGKLLQIVLAGQPEFDTKLDQPELRQLKQRIVLRCSLHPFTEAETREYIETRLERAGMPDQTVFSPDVLAEIHTRAQGIPRLINAICDNLLLTTYAVEGRVATIEMLDDVSEQMHLQWVPVHRPTQPAKPSAGEGPDAPAPRPKITRFRKTDASQGSAFRAGQPDERRFARPEAPFPTPFLSAVAPKLAPVAQTALSEFRVPSFGQSPGPVELDPELRERNARSNLGFLWRPALGTAALIGVAFAGIQFWQLTTPTPSSTWANSSDTSEAAVTATVPAPAASRAQKGTSKTRTSGVSKGEFAIQTRQKKTSKAVPAPQPVQSEKAAAGAEETTAPPPRSEPVPPLLAAAPTALAAAPPIPGAPSLSAPTPSLSAVASPLSAVASLRAAAGQTVIDPKSARQEPAVRTPATPVASRFAGAWTYPANGLYYGPAPDIAEMTVREDNGHLIGALSVRFKSASQGVGEPLLRFSFSGDVRGGGSQTFNLESKDGGTGTIELIPGTAPSLLEVNFHVRQGIARTQSANMILVRR